MVALWWSVESLSDLMVVILLITSDKKHIINKGPHK